MTDEPWVSAVTAIRAGDVVALGSMLRATPGLSTGRADGRRTLLHVATDWPGHRPRVAESIAVLVDAGADVDAPFLGDHAERPLHWAASCDDIEALDALLDAGASIDVGGGAVGDGSGTPLFDATVFGQWVAARRLVARGATTGGWEEAALGLTDALAARLARGATRDELTRWFWAACHGGQRSAGELLLAAGAERDRVSAWDGTTPLDAAARAATDTPGAAEVVAWLRAAGARRAADRPG